MAIKTYLYRASGLTAADIEPLLAVGASPVVGAPLPDALLPITIDDSHKEDLDDAMADFGYAFVAEYTGVAPLTSRRDFGVLAADPTSPAPANGDMYYNSTLEMEMRYDASRSKWLSIEAEEFTFGRNGNTAAGQFYRTVNGRVMSSSLGWRMGRNGTVVDIQYTRRDADAATFDVVADGVSIGTLASIATNGGDPSFDSDFNNNQVLAVQNQAGGNTTSDVVGWVKVKWRS